MNFVEIGEAAVRAYNARFQKEFVFRENAAQLEAAGRAAVAKMIPALLDGRCAQDCPFRIGCEWNEADRTGRIAPGPNCPAGGRE